MNKIYLPRIDAIYSTGELSPSNLDWNSVYSTGELSSSNLGYDTFYSTTKFYKSINASHTLQHMARLSRTSTRKGDVSVVVKDTKDVLAKGCDVTGR